MFHVSDQPIKSHFAGDQPISFSDRCAIGLHTVLTGFSSDQRFASQSPPANFKAAKGRSVFRLAETKNDILDQLKLSIDKVYTDFELVETPEVDEGSDVTSETSSRASLAAKIDQLAAPAPSPITVTGDNADFKALALEFGTLEKSSAALHTDLAELVNGLIDDKVLKEKLDQLQDK